MSRRGADALVRVLAEEGIRRLFTLSGNHVMPVFDATLGSGVDLLHTRHEAATVHMADAWARLSKQTGVALVTGGPGHANAVSALYTAAMSESPVVLLSGHAPLAQLGRGAFQEMRQADMAAPVTKASWVCASADALAGDLRKALQIARSGRPGPVHLSLPSDALEAAVGEAPGQTAPAAGAAGPALPDADAQAIVGRLRKGLRPLVIVGPALMDRAGRQRCAELALACDVPVVGMQSPRGINDPALGAFSEVLAQSDCILLLGKKLDFTLKFGAAPAIDAACEFLQIDPDAVELERSRLLGSRVILRRQASADAALTALLAAASRARRPGGGWRDEVAAAIAYRPAAWDQARATSAGRMHPVQACRPLQALLDSHPDSVLVCDGGEIGQWAQACLQAPNLVINGAAGAIGVGVPFALAARLARPGAPVVAVMGDGSVGFHIAEYDTALRYALPFVGVVGNDARWNAEYQIQLADYGPGRTVGCELRPATRYDAVVAALGGHGSLVEEATQMDGAVAAAHACRLPACVNVLIEGVAAPVVRR
jgi:acetolactate synthase-1/2/3 large subunit